MVSHKTCAYGRWGCISKGLHCRKKNFSWTEEKIDQDTRNISFCSVIHLHDSFKNEIALVIYSSISFEKNEIEKVAEGATSEKALVPYKVVGKVKMSNWKKTNKQCNTPICYPLNKVKNILIQHTWPSSPWNKRKDLSNCGTIKSPLKQSFKPWIPTAHARNI